MSLIALDAIWEYQVTTNDIPPDPTAVTIPSSGWTAGGVAPFGNGVADSHGNLPNTNWDLSTGLWIRRNVVLNGEQPVELQGFIDNAMFLYFDGQFVGSVNPTLAAAAGDWSFVVPASLCTAGTHQIAVLCLEDDVTPGGDRGFISLFADYLPLVLPYQPRAPLSERLSWLTDVQTAKDGSEERTQYRIKARQEFKMIYPVDINKQRRAFLMTYSERHSQWNIPVWTQATNVGAISSGANSVTADGTIGDYRVGGYALVWESHETWQIVTVSSLGSSSITFLEEAEAFTNAWVMPLRIGFLKSNPSKVFSGYRAEYELDFQVEDNVDLAPAAPAQFLGEDIYYDESLLSGDSLSDDIVGNLELQDEDLGVVKYYAPWLHSKVARTHRVVCEGPEEAWAFREWAYRRLGRFRGFWQPSFEADLKHTTTGAIAATLTVEDDGYLAFGGDRTHIAIETASGWLPRTITAAVAAGSNIQLTLSSALSIDAADIKRICWLGFKRLNSDTVEINWPGGGICEAEMRLLELEG